MEQAKVAAITTWNTRFTPFPPQQQAEPVLSRWIGCGECDCTFKCYGSGKECIRLPMNQQAEPPPEWPLVKNILDEYGLDAITFVAKWKAAQRPWVGLEAEEILDLFDRNNVYGSKWIEFARTVEAKLRSKNDY